MPNTELHYNTPTYNDKHMDNQKLSNSFLKSIGFTAQWSNSLDMYVYKKEDVVVYETIGGYMYDHSGVIMYTLVDLQREVEEEWGEPLEI